MISKEPDGDMPLEVKIFFVSSYLIELLDETAYSTSFKHNLKAQIRRVQKNLEEMVEEPIETDALSLFMSQATKALEDTLIKGR